MEGALSGALGRRHRRRSRCTLPWKQGHGGASTGATAFLPEVQLASFRCGHGLSHPAGVSPVWPPSLEMWLVRAAVRYVSKQILGSEGFVQKKKKKSMYNVSLMAFSIVNTLK